MPPEYGKLVKSMPFLPSSADDNSVYDQISCHRVDEDIISRIRSLLMSRNVHRPPITPYPSDEERRLCFPYTRLDTSCRFRTARTAVADTDLSSTLDGTNGTISDTISDEQRGRKRVAPITEDVEQSFGSGTISDVISNETRQQSTASKIPADSPTDAAPRLRKVSTISDFQSEPAVLQNTKSKSPKKWFRLPKLVIQDKKKRVAETRSCFEVYPHLPPSDDQTREDEIDCRPPLDPADKLPSKYIVNHPTMPGPALKIQPSDLACFLAGCPPGRANCEKHDRQKRGPVYRESIFEGRMPDDFRQLGESLKRDVAEMGLSMRGEKRSTPSQSDTESYVIDQWKPTTNRSSFGTKGTFGISPRARRTPKPPSLVSPVSSSVNSGSMDAFPLAAHYMELAAKEKQPQFSTTVATNFSLPGYKERRSSKRASVILRRQLSESSLPESTSTLGRTVNEVLSRRLPDDSVTSTIVPQPKSQTKKPEVKPNPAFNDPKWQKQDVALTDTSSLPAVKEERSPANKSSIITSVGSTVELSPIRTPNWEPIEDLLSKVTPVSEPRAKNSTVASINATKEPIKDSMSDDSCDELMKSAKPSGREPKAKTSREPLKSSGTSIISKSVDGKPLKSPLSPVQLRGWLDERPFEALINYTIPPREDSTIYNPSNASLTQTRELCSISEKPSQASTPKSKSYSPSVVSSVSSSAIARHALLKASITDLRPLDVGLPIPPLLSSVPAEAIVTPAKVSDDGIKTNKKKSIAAVDPKRVPSYASPVMAPLLGSINRVSPEPGSECSDTSAPQSTPQQTSVSRHKSTPQQSSVSRHNTEHRTIRRPVEASALVVEQALAVVPIPEPPSIVRKSATTVVKPSKVAPRSTTMPVSEPANMSVTTWIADSASALASLGESTAETVSQTKFAPILTPGTRPSSVLVSPSRFSSVLSPTLASPSEVEFETSGEPVRSSVPSHVSVTKAEAAIEVVSSSETAARILSESRTASIFVPAGEPVIEAIDSILVSTSETLPGPTIDTNSAVATVTESIQTQKAVVAPKPNSALVSEPATTPVSFVQSQAVSVHVSDPKVASRPVPVSQPSPEPIRVSEVVSGSLTESTPAVVPATAKADIGVIEKVVKFDNTEPQLEVQAATTKQNISQTEGKGELILASAIEPAPVLVPLPRPASARVSLSKAMPVFTYPPAPAPVFVFPPAPVYVFPPGSTTSYAPSVMPTPLPTPLSAMIPSVTDVVPELSTSVAVTNTTLAKDQILVKNDSDSNLAVKWEDRAKKNSTLQSDNKLMSNSAIVCSAPIHLEDLQKARDLVETVRGQIQQVEDHMLRGVTGEGVACPGPTIEEASKRSVKVEIDNLKEVRDPETSAVTQSEQVSSVEAMPTSKPGVASPKIDETAVSPRAMTVNEVSSQTPERVADLTGTSIVEAVITSKSGDMSQTAINAVVSDTTVDAVSANVESALTGLTSVGATSAIIETVESQAAIQSTSGAPEVSFIGPGPVAVDNTLVSNSILESSGEASKQPLQEAESLAVQSVESKVLIQANNEVIEQARKISESVTQNLTIVQPERSKSTGAGLIGGEAAVQISEVVSRDLSPGISPKSTIPVAVMQTADESVALASDKISGVSPEVMVPSPELPGNLSMKEKALSAPEPTAALNAAYWGFVPAVKEAVQEAIEVAVRNAVQNIVSPQSKEERKSSEARRQIVAESISKASKTADEYLRQASQWNDLSSPPRESEGTVIFTGRKTKADTGAYKTQHSVHDSPKRGVETTQSPVSINKNQENGSPTTSDRPAISPTTLQTDVGVGEIVDNVVSHVDITLPLGVISEEVRMTASKSDDKLGASENMTGARLSKAFKKGYAPIPSRASSQSRVLSPRSTAANSITKFSPKGSVSTLIKKRSFERVDSPASRSLRPVSSTGSLKSVAAEEASAILESVISKDNIIIPASDLSSQIPEAGVRISRIPSKKDDTARNLGRRNTVHWLKDLLSSNGPYEAQFTAFPKRTATRSQTAPVLQASEMTSEFPEATASKVKRVQTVNATENISKTIVDLENLMNEAILMARQAADSQDPGLVPKIIDNAVKALQKSRTADHVAGIDYPPDVERKVSRKSAVARSRSSSVASIHESLRSYPSSDSELENDQENEESLAATRSIVVAAIKPSSRHASGWPPTGRAMTPFPPATMPPSRESPKSSPETAEKRFSVAVIAKSDSPQGLEKSGSAMQSSGKRISSARIDTKQLPIRPDEKVSKAVSDQIAAKISKTTEIIVPVSYMSESGSSMIPRPEFKTKEIFSEVVSEKAVDTRKSSGSPRSPRRLSPAKKSRTEDPALSVVAIELEEMSGESCANPGIMRGRTKTHPSRATTFATGPTLAERQENTSNLGSKTFSSRVETKSKVKSGVTATTSRTYDWQNITSSPLEIEEVPPPQRSPPPVPNEAAARNLTSGINTLDHFMRDHTPSKYSHSLDGSAADAAELLDFDAGYGHTHHGGGVSKGKPQQGIELQDKVDPNLPQTAAPVKSKSHPFALGGKRHISLNNDHLKGFSFVRSHKKAKIARDWSPGRKRFVAAVSCVSTALVGILVGIYAGETPAIQYYIVDFHHYTVLGNVFFFIGLAVSTLLFWPLPLLHGRKPYILGAMSLAMPLLFPQALAVGQFRSPYLAGWRIGLLLPRAFMGFCLGFANMNFKAMLTDLFGASLQSQNPHQEHVDEFDVRRHGGGMGAWLGLWTWCAVGSIGFGFMIGAVIIDTLSPAWGFYVSIAIIAFVMFLNVLCPEVRRSAFRRSVAEVIKENAVSRRLARGEVKMHMVQSGPKWWGEEFHYGLMLSNKMLRQPGFLIMALYTGWIYGQNVLIISLLGALMSKDYKMKSPHVGASVMALPIGALLAIPFQKASFFSRARNRIVNTDDTTLKKKMSWSSHMLRRSIFVLCLPIAGILYTATSSGPPIPFIIPILFAGIIGFLSSLALAECSGIIMETFDTSDLQPGMTGRPRKSSDDPSASKRTNYSSFPRVQAAFAMCAGIGYLLASAAAGVGGSLTRHLGQQAATGIMAGILLILSLLLLATLIRFTEVQIIPDSKKAEMMQYHQARRMSTIRREGGIVEEEPWRPVIIGNPHHMTRRMCLLELGSMSRFSEIRKKNKLIDEKSLEAAHPNLAAIEDAKHYIHEMEHELKHKISQSLSRSGSRKRQFTGDMPEEGDLGGHREMLTRGSSGKGSRRRVADQSRMNTEVVGKVIPED